ncbi:serine/threonine-protein kinase [Actinomadura darangshiensis]|uniref:serine/threonine-protein kinase n=1 Tax=Actinomadura darangshiensis TaxID=705336 RepID=UPI00140A5F11|nr:serine/threonine-protein kinase [Actinomadura darangshiensis]
MSPPEPLDGRYRLGGRLGSGGMGTVWRARDEELGRDVAVKELTLPPEISGARREQAVQRALREARAAARLRHPGIVTVHTVVHADGRPWIVMELLSGRSLDQVLKHDGPLDPRRAAVLGIEMLDALSAAHEQGVLHRDVKPANIFLRDDGRAVLTDFGIAALAGDASLTRPGALIGSPAYMAPERVRGEPGGPPSDLWSLGATLYALTEGRPPFGRSTPLGVLGAVLTEPPAPPRLAGPLTPLLLRLLDKNPDRRPAAALAHRELRAIADPAPARGRRSRGAGAAPASARWWRSRGAEPAPAPWWRSGGAEPASAPGRGSRGAEPALAPRWRSRGAAPGPPLRRRFRRWHGASAAAAALFIAGAAALAMTHGGSEERPAAWTPAPTFAAVPPVCGLLKADQIGRYVASPAAAPPTVKLTNPANDYFAQGPAEQSCTWDDPGAPGGRESRATVRVRVAEGTSPEDAVVVAVSAFNKLEGDARQGQYTDTRSPRPEAISDGAGDEAYKIGTVDEKGRVHRATVVSRTVNLLMEVRFENRIPKPLDNDGLFDGWERLYSTATQIGQWTLTALQAVRTHPPSPS